MNNCIIIHGCPSRDEETMDEKTRTYDKHWMPWVKGELDRVGIPTQIPSMPNPWEPNYAAYKEVLEKYPISENTILIGHSCGCAFLVRWLGDSRQKIKKLILVAPWKVVKEGDEIKKNFYTYPIDPTIKERVSDIIMFTAPNEEENGKRSLKMYHDVLGGKIISLDNHGHYTQADMGIIGFPELVKEIIT